MPALVLVLLAQASRSDDQLALARRQVAELASQLHSAAAATAAEREGCSGADQAVRLAAAAQVAAAEEARGLAERRAVEAEEAHAAAGARCEGWGSRRALLWVPIVREWWAEVTERGGKAVLGGCDVCNEGGRGKKAAVVKVMDGTM